MYLGDDMEIYIDLVFLLNMAFDFLLLMTVNIVLCRGKKIVDILSGSIVGGFSIFLLFYIKSSFTLFILKIIISVIMLVITFGYNDLRYFIRNFIYLYMTSIVLGGFLYLLNLQLSYKNNGIVFYHDGLSINFIFLLITSPIIIYIYIKQCKYLKNNYNHYHNITLIYNNKKINLIGFVDTGNHVVDPVTKKSVILIDKRKFIYNLNMFKMNLIPIFTATGNSLLKCVSVDEVIIDKNRKINVLIGLMDNKIPIDGVDCILNEKILEG